MFEDRFYRQDLKADGLLGFEIKIDETDMLIWADSDYSKAAFRLTRYLRYQLKKYIQFNFSFLKSLKPLKIDLKAPQIVQAMQSAAVKAGVGPMAAVAGALAEFVGSALKKKSSEVIIENGGDIYIDSPKERLIKIYAGSSVLSEKLALKIKPQDCPLGICCSSATVGHSKSFGIADACCVISKSASLADAFATALANNIKDENHIKDVLEKFAVYDEVLGAVVIVKDKMGYIGDIELIKLAGANGR